MSARTVPPGVRVDKAAANLPQTATANLYTVAGGAVLVTGLIGTVTTGLGATATTLSLGVTGSPTVIATASAITSAVANTFLFPIKSAGIGGALQVAGAAFVLAPPFIIDPFIVATGNITWTTSANDTGQVKWSLWYVPMDAGATVT